MFSPNNKLVQEVLRLDGPVMRVYRIWRRIWNKAKEEYRATELKPGSEKDSSGGDT